jgi:hypothetical protein
MIAGLFVGLTAESNAPRKQDDDNIYGQRYFACATLINFLYCFRVIAQTFSSPNQNGSHWFSGQCQNRNPLFRHYLRLRLLSLNRPLQIHNSIPPWLPILIIRLAVSDPVFRRQRIRYHRARPSRLRWHRQTSRS